MGGSYLRNLQINGIVPVGVSAINADDWCIDTVALPLFPGIVWVSAYRGGFFESRCG